ncbi:MAG: alpha-N-acetylglucosaminidase [Flectobacillus sp.]|uniref:alpha-N-acetylglucosaminidase n=1 Tax=Flectobacillus sp. TaxID=50419 RepID=UPI003B9B15C9
MKTFYQTLKICGILLGLVVGADAMAQLNIKESQALIARVIPQRAESFVVESLSTAAPFDFFEIESKNNKIVLRGNNGVSVASALYYYLTEYCHCQITWNGENLDLPTKLPLLSAKITKSSPYQYRYYLNYCTFNYSMSWWNWDRWQKEIDWMAMHGITMPLAITGEEYTWREVYNEMGFSDNDLKDFFSGPAYFSWFWMGNLDGWGGPLPVSWMKSHKDLQLKILQRERALGMTPVLPAFTGHVPAAFKKKYPKAKLKATNWTNGFGDTYILDSEDPLFAELGKKFIDKQTKLFGTNHLYSADTFNENEPPTDEPAYLSKLSARIYEGIRQADPNGIWVMQGWLFYSDRKFWKAPQIEALLNAVPNNKMLLLDLATEIEPVWKRTEAFYGKPWIWNMLNNFGGNVNLFGRMDGVASGPALALNDPNSKNLQGIGLTMEAIEQNPVIYELMMQHTWQTTPINLDEWIVKYAKNRYKTDDKSLVEAWQILRKTVYNGKDIRDGAESIITGRPTFDSTTIWTRTKLNYPPKELLPAWDLFIEASKKGVNSDGFQYDVVDITRQVLANYALILQKKWKESYKTKNAAQFKVDSEAFLTLISDMDALLATRKDFMLGPWINSARTWGTTPQEKALYEQNARDLVTLWGDANSPLHEYSNRQWSGLLNDFYKPRWTQFFKELTKAMSENKEPDLKAFDEQIRNWEWKWVTTQKSFPTSPQGSSITLAQKLHLKYQKALVEAYK